MERQLFSMASEGRLLDVREILRRNPQLNVNWKGSLERTSLHIACYHGSESVATLLLLHPDTNVNQKDIGGETPFFLACVGGKSACVRLLLKDPRVLNPNEPDSMGYTPLREIAYCGHLEVAKMWIAYGKVKLGTPGDSRTDAIGTARRNRNWEMTALLERFTDHPEQTRHDVRLQVGYYEEMAAEVFALMVFHCDGLLELRGNPRYPLGLMKQQTRKLKLERQKRFFTIAQRLPIELQMVLCHRLVGLAKVNIAVKRRELAFMALARAFQR